MRMRVKQRRGLRGLRWTVRAAFVVPFITLAAVAMLGTFFNTEDATDVPRIGRRLLQATAASAVESRADRALTEQEEADAELGNYPPELFTVSQWRRGAVLLHVLGMLYMFVGLAIVCDELFCVALEVMSEVLGISDDVAGATLMAAGGSMPELFTSLIGTLIAPSDVGIGTVVGSACFNVLFVIGMCALFSRELLRLTWWPLFRDVSFYVLDLVLLAIFFLDDKIEWYEALVMFLLYGLYVGFMNFNQRVEHWVKQRIVSRLVRKGHETGELAEGDDDASKLTGVAANMARQLDQPKHKVNVQTFRIGALSLMLGNMDARGVGPHREKETRFQRAVDILLESKRLGVDPAKIAAEADEREKNEHGEAATATDPEAAGGGGAKPSGRSASLEDGTEIQEMGDTPPLTATSTSERQLDSSTSSSSSSSSSSASKQQSDQQQQPRRLPNLMLSAAVRQREKEAKEASEAEQNGGTATGENGGASEQGNDDDDDDDDDNAFDLRMPEGAMAKVVYIVLFPITFSLWLTVPNCARPEKRKYWLVTFLMSLLWITIFSFLMVFFATVVGLAAKIPIAVMGLTLIAAGTSVPDLISSVVVARKGLGDMAVSSSIGSNIFDITFGLPVPWLIFSAINAGDPVVVESEAIGLLVLLLLLMLLAVIVTIALSGWAMTKTLGVTMFALYGVFLTVALLLEFDVIEGF